MDAARSWNRVALLAMLLGGAAIGQSVTRVSVDTTGAQGNGSSDSPSMSVDALFLVFESTSDNFMPGDTNVSQDVFIRDLSNGTTELVSVNSLGVLGNGDSFSSGPPSADGRYVAFWSYASNLVPGDLNSVADVFVRDRQGGTTERVSLDTAGNAGDGDSYTAAISADGRYVVFESAAANLVPGDTNGAWDVFVRDRLNGTSERVSLDSARMEGNGDSYSRWISLDGRYIVFESVATNLVLGDTNGVFDVFVRDRLNGTTERVSIGSGGAQGNNRSGEPSMSADNRYVAFLSDASNLVPGDTNGVRDVFVRDRLNGITERMSIDSFGVEGNGGSQPASISADGRYVAFNSFATNLVVGDTNASVDAFRHDRQTGVTVRTSIDSGGGQGNGYSQVTIWSISADGRYVAFDSQASNLVPGDTNGGLDAFLHDLGEPPVSFCFGDGSAAPCPCGNSGMPGHGCENSSSTGGALQTWSGTASLSADTLVLMSSLEGPTSVSIFFQGDSPTAPLVYGDGLRCSGGVLKRLYVKSAIGGVAIAPEAGDLSITIRSAALGSPIPANGTRYYQVYYRDDVAPFCPSPTGNNWNVSNALSVLWSP